MYVRVLLLLLVLTTLSGMCKAQVEELSEPARTLEDLRTRWLAAQPQHIGDTYITPTSPKTPYVEGKLAPDFLDDGLRMLNFLRYVAGVPDDLVLDATGNGEEQHGAVLMDAIKTMTHTPSQPADMPDDFYQVGKESCGSSCVYAEQQSLNDAVRGWVQDDGNLPLLGHRRWMLYPSLKRTAFGFSNGYCVMSCFGLVDQNRPADPPYTAIPWPPPGLFPTQLFGPGEMWSVALNPTLFKPDGNETVTFIRLTDRKSWELTQADRDEKGKYLTVDTQRYGVPYNLVFHIPAEEIHVHNGEAYQVEVKGLMKTTGEPVELRWRTEFVNLGANLNGARINSPLEHGLNPQPPTLAFTNDLPIVSVEWKLKRADEKPGWFYLLGSGKAGPLDAGENVLPLPVTDNTLVVTAGAPCWVEYTVTDQYTTTDYRVDFTVQ